MCNSEQHVCAACGKRFTLWWDGINPVVEREQAKAWHDMQAVPNPICDACAPEILGDD
jgi:hypothetical protein